jgi:trehalose 6-phosphate synthase/phosphatase
MFRTMKDHAYTIKVGRANTAAQYTILSQKEVYPFLGRFVLPVAKNQKNYS